jgi:hypothetical protein
MAETAVGDRFRADVARPGQVRHTLSDDALDETG